MNHNTKATSSGGIGFLGLLAIVFITLKLTGYITWSWWLVLLPLWWWVPFLGVMLVIWVILMACLWFMERGTSHRR